MEPIVSKWLAATLPRSHTQATRSWVWIGFNRQTHLFCWREGQLSQAKWRESHDRVWVGASAESTLAWVCIRSHHAPFGFGNVTRRGQPCAVRCHDGRKRISPIPLFAGRNDLLKRVDNLTIDPEATISAINGHLRRTRYGGWFD